MLISRGTSALKVLKELTKLNAQFKPAIRNSGHATWRYRCAPPQPPRENIIAAEVIGGFFWWWILWHVWTEPGHVTGDFKYPDAREWTDEELGIPEDLEIE